MKSAFLSGILLTSLLTVSCKDAGAKPNTDAAAIAKTTKDATPAVKPEVAVAKIEGMTCAIGCAKAIEDKLNETTGIQQAKVDFDKKEAVIQFDLDKLKEDDLKSIIESTADGESYKVTDLTLGKKG